MKELISPSAYAEDDTNMGGKGGSSPPPSSTDARSRTYSLKSFAFDFTLKSSSWVAGDVGTFTLMNSNAMT